MPSLNCERMSIKRRPQRGVVCLLALVCLVVVINLAMAQFHFSFVLEKNAHALGQGIDLCDFQSNGSVCAMQAFMTMGEGCLDISGMTCPYEGISEVTHHVAVSAVLVRANEQPQWGRPNRVLVSWLAQAPSETGPSTSWVEDHIVVIGCQDDWTRLTAP